MAEHRYRILALSGGGVRGLFQAAFLSRLERDVPAVGSQFDLIAATSTGALVGLALAAGVPAAAIEDLYRQHAKAIFTPRTAAWFRRGARYRNDHLRDLLTELFGDKRLGELPVEVLICAAGLERFQGKAFGRGDDVRIVDAALASAAAPTFFPPIVPLDSDRGYIDGGLWANDPLLVAVAHARRGRGIPTSHIDALSVGTGRIPRGSTAREAAAMHTLSFDTVRFFLQISGSLQEWAATHLLERLTNAHVDRINPELVRWVGLDDYEGAVLTLPGIAELEYEMHGERIASWLVAPRAEVRSPPVLPRNVQEGVREANLTAFMPARSYYKRFRGADDSISGYVSTATRTLTMVSINLATGGELERIERVFSALVSRPSPVKVRVSLLDYKDEWLMRSIASILDMEVEDITERISRTMRTLVDAREALDPETTSCLELYRHRTIPSASAILLDANYPNGRIQLETKPYKAPSTESWAIEIGAGSDFFETIRTAYHNLLDDGVEVLRDHNAGRPD